MFNHIKIDTLPKIVQKTKPNGRRTYAIPDGTEYPSVTTILGDKEKPWLDKWRTMLGEKKATKETKRCADRGTVIHSLAEKYLNNEEIIHRDHKPEYIADFNKMKLGLNKINNIHAQEVGLYSDLLKTAGTVDCVGEYKNQLSIIDFKTSTNIKQRDMIDDYFKQCCAYAICWHERTGIAIENLVIIIAVEKAMMPLIFTDTIENWIAPLLLDIDTFYKKNK